MFQMLLTVLAHWAVQLVLIPRVMLRPHREPASRVAWVAVIALLPGAGAVLYFLFGEVNPGRSRLRKLPGAAEEPPPLPETDPMGNGGGEVPDRWEPLSRAARYSAGFPATRGNRITMPADSDAVTDELVADIDGARGHIHLLYYIWLPDRSGGRVAEALRRAARRGVICRVMVDSLGSRMLLRSALWRDMGRDGVLTAEALPVGHILGHLLAGGRLDMRNHRKIAVIDGRITYCGSQNCAAPEFTIKADYAPWVDAVLRIEGPAALQNLRLFARDWTSATGERLDELLTAPGTADADTDADPAGCVVQTVAGGPSLPPQAMPDVFIHLLHEARSEVVITTPYYVPDEPLHRALCACARRGISTTLIVPARNDSKMVAAASRSYYADLLDAGVRLFEFTKGLLHAKTFVADGEVTLFGSANIDRRSFDLNQENNALIYDRAAAALVRARQNQYLAQSVEVTTAGVAAWSRGRRLWNNTMAVLGPLI